jgi:hypothetical protein
MVSQLFRSGITLTSTVSAGILILSSLSLNVQAQQSSTQPRGESKKTAIRYRPPAGQEKPKTTVSGGTRTTCSLDQTLPIPSLTVLLPQDKLGLTTRQHPQFFVYVPQTEATEAEFLLIDPNGDYEYRARYTLPKTGGVVKIELPQSEIALEVGTEYEWMFAIVCDPDSRDKDIVDGGVVKLTELSSTQNSQLAQAEPLKRTQLYAEYGIWYDAVATLAALTCSNSNHPALNSSWQQLLTSEPVKLDLIITQPFIECGTLQVRY